MYLCTFLCSTVSPGWTTLGFLVGKQGTENYMKYLFHKLSASESLTRKTSIKVYAVPGNMYYIAAIKIVSGNMLHFELRTKKKLIVKDWYKKWRSKTDYPNSYKYIVLVCTKLINKLNCKSLILYFLLRSTIRQIDC